MRRLDKWLKPLSAVNQMLVADQYVELRGHLSRWTGVLKAISVFRMQGLLPRRILIKLTFLAYFRDVLFGSLSVAQSTWVRMERLVSSGVEKRHETYFEKRRALCSMLGVADDFSLILNGGPFDGDKDYPKKWSAAFSRAQSLLGGKKVALVVPGPLSDEVPDSDAYDYVLGFNLVSLNNWCAPPEKTIPIYSYLRARESMYHISKVLSRVPLAIIRPLDTSQPWASGEHFGSMPEPRISPNVYGPAGLHRVVCGLASLGVARIDVYGSTFSLSVDQQRYRQKYLAALGRSGHRTAEWSIREHDPLRDFEDLRELWKIGLVNFEGHAGTLVRLTIEEFAAVLDASFRDPHELAGRQSSFQTWSFQKARRLVSFWRSATSNLSPISKTLSKALRRILERVVGSKLSRLYSDRGERQEPLLGRAFEPSWVWGLAHRCATREPGWSDLLAFRESIVGTFTQSLRFRRDALIQALDDSDSRRASLAGLELATLDDSRNPEWRLKTEETDKTDEGVRQFLSIVDDEGAGGKHLSLLGPGIVTDEEMDLVGRSDAVVLINPLDDAAIPSVGEVHGYFTGKAIRNNEEKFRSVAYGLTSINVKNSSLLKYCPDENRMKTRVYRDPRPIFYNPARNRLGEKFGSLGGGPMALQRILFDLLFQVHYRQQLIGSISLFGFDLYTSRNVYLESYSQVHHQGSRASAENGLRIHEPFSNFAFLRHFRRSPIVNIRGRLSEVLELSADEYAALLDQNFQR